MLMSQRRRLPLLLGVSVFLFLSMPGLSAQFAGGEWTYHRQFTGEAAYDNLGYGLAGGVDINGDGCDDQIVGAPNGDGLNLEDCGQVYVYSGITGELLWTMQGDQAFARFGTSVAGLGDLDSDGHDEFAVGAPNASSGVRSKNGAVFVFSGRTGDLLARFDGSKSGDNFGFSIARVPDLNGDQRDELIIGSPFAQPGGMPVAGSAVVLSVVDGQVLFRFDSPRAYAWFASAVNKAGDVDNDGVGDLVVGATFYDPSGVATDNAGAAFVYSGATGDRIGFFLGERQGDMLGNAVDALGDINNDGYDDVVVGAYLTKPNGLDGVGSVYVFSGFDGEILLRYDGISPYDKLGWSVAGIGDYNGDGVADLAAGAPNVDVGNYMDAGTLYLISGSTGEPMKVFEGEGDYARKGWFVAQAGDINDDGVQELIVSAIQATRNSMEETGEAYIYGHQPYLYTSDLTVSASAGGRVNLFADFPNSDIGYPYQLLASAAGTGPVQLGSVWVPLSWDQAFQTLYNGNSPAWVYGATGVLDGFANATIMVDFPAGKLTSLVGNHVYFSVVCSDPQNNPIRVSVAHAVEVTP